MKILFVSLGCDKNLVDSEHMSGLLSKAGYEFTDDETQADIINAPVNRPCCVETTAMGAAYLAGLAVGYWKDTEEIKENWQLDRVFTASMPQEKRQELVRNWKRAVDCALYYAKWEEEHD